MLKTYFDSVNLGRAKTDDELIDLFRLDLAERQDSGNLPARTLREAGHLPSCASSLPRPELFPPVAGPAHRAIV